MCDDGFRIFSYLYLKRERFYFGIGVLNTVCPVFEKSSFFWSWEANLSIIALGRILAFLHCITSLVSPLTFFSGLLMEGFGLNGQHHHKLGVITARTMLETQYT